MPYVPRRAGPHERDRRDLRDGDAPGTGSTSCTRRCRPRSAPPSREVTGAPGLVNCRFTHVYPDGAGAVLHGGRRRPARLRGGHVGRREDGRDGGADAAAARTVTHHHAVGRDHRPGYDRQRPEPFAVALRAAKAALDPAGVLNPGVLDRPRVERDRMTEQSAWMRMTEEDPEHSAAYVQRFRTLAEQGMDLVGEARLVDAMLPRGVAGAGRRLRAGPGGRAPARGRARGGRCGRRPGADRRGRGGPPRRRAGWSATWPSWTCRAQGIAEPFDAIVCAGNVMTFLAVEHPAGGAAPDARAHRRPDGTRGHRLRRRPRATSSTTSWPTPAPPAGPRTCCCPPGTCGRSRRTPTSSSRCCRPV